jgi:hypothetical protein
MEFKNVKCIWLASLLLLFKANIVNSQIPVYADTSYTDSIKTAIDDLFAELDHAGLGKFAVYPLHQFKSNGFVLLMTGQEKNDKIKIPQEFKKLWTGRYIY